MKNYHMYTKEEVRKVQALWNTKTASEICKELGVDKSQLGYLVAQMKKAGMILSRKHITGSLNTLIKEIIAENNK